MTCKYIEPEQIGKRIPGNGAIRPRAGDSGPGVFPGNGSHLKRSDYSSIISSGPIPGPATLITAYLLS